MSTTTSAPNPLPAATASATASTATAQAQTPMSAGTDFAALVQGSTDETDKTLVIRQVVPGMITFSVPFTRMGVLAIGGRSTAIRLQNSTEPGIFVYASHSLTPATRSAIEKLGGEVKWLVTPDGEHDMHMQQWVDAFPGAKPIGVARLKDRKPNIKWAGLFGAGGDDLKYGFEPEISLHSVSSHSNHELVAIHHPTRTLLEADLMFNLPGTEQYSRAGQPGLFKASGAGGHLQPGSFLHDKMMHGVLKKGDKLRSELLPLKNADWDRLIPCHGDVIESGGKEAWLKVFNPFL